MAQGSQSPERKKRKQQDHEDMGSREKKRRKSNEDKRQERNRGRTMKSTDPFRAIKEVAAFDCLKDVGGDLRLGREDVNLKDGAQAWDRGRSRAVLTASASAFSRELRPPATTDSSTATQRCLSGKLGAMKYMDWPGQQVVWGCDSSFSTKEFEKEKRRDKEFYSEAHERCGAAQWSLYIGGRATM
ncbi:hypothetical protein JZ751_001382 [Albula glossodonta]|uniref:Uncharacterized protein n=1 Tax=Albula glossodonta TaxID=121402 RepID=A0A8T2PTK7_9TELE|nr:hypothetical protein JZ751_001382 [Albula glossodonta]